MKIVIFILRDMVCLAMSWCHVVPMSCQVLQQHDPPNRLIAVLYKVRPRSVRRADVAHGKQVSSNAEGNIHN